MVETTVGVFYVLYALACLPCIKEIPAAYHTRAECEVAGAKWTQGSYRATWHYFGGMTPGSSRAFSCYEERLTERGLNAYGGVK